MLFRSWFWANPALWRPMSATAWIPIPDGVLSATVTAEPKDLVFATEDSVANTGITESTTCAGPGQDWNFGWGDLASSPCSYAYRHASSTQFGKVFEARMSIVWEMSWTSSLGIGGSLGRITTGVPASIRVQELQALIR